uniref:Uncharacterized protein n=1 Tax=Nelumbo nucifera TaxID=4432 RepID=A0A822Y642_NELNU|nr:TPA_asm: hypothetical protein HUJ06_026532 [Nelumbo nucifera]
MELHKKMAIARESKTNFCWIKRSANYLALCKVKNSEIKRD